MSEFRDDYASMQTIEQKLTPMGQVLEDLVTREENRHRVPVALNEGDFEISESGTRTINIDGTKCLLTDNSREQLSTMLGVDYGYFSNSSPDADEETYVVNHRLNRLAQGDSPLRLGHAPGETADRDKLAAWLVDNKVAGFVNMDVVRVPAYKVATSVFDVIGGDDAFVRNYTPELDAVTLDIVSRNVFTEVEHNHKGDYTYGGLSFNHTDGGNGVTKLWSFLYRLVCTNGMLAKHNIRVQRLNLTRHGEDDAIERYVEMFAGAASTHWGDIRQRLQHFRDTYDRRDTDWTREITEMTGVSFNTRQMIARAYDENPMEHSYYGFLNAVSRVAHNDTLTMEEGRRLEERVGTLIQEDMARCTNCGQKVRARVRAPRGSRGLVFAGME